MNDKQTTSPEPLITVVRRLIVMQAVSRTRRIKGAANLLGVGQGSVVQVLRSAGFAPHEKPDGIYLDDLDRVRAFLADAVELDPGFDRAHLGC